MSIALEVGPEVVAGSTRMKGGLAQKMVLHMLSTSAMVQLGRVEGNLMTRLAPVSSKLQSRAARIFNDAVDHQIVIARAAVDQLDGGGGDGHAVDHRGAENRRFAPDPG